MSQVGFSIQADVIGGGSLLHAATGRLLKALSDGGIDFYAVAAAVQLGKIIPIQSAHESSVSRLLAERGGRSGFIAKALKIGWGHSDVPIEMARTRAGTSALLTINALATGSSAYSAAQALAALLTMSGCEPDMLPNIDVLKNMVVYLSPFLAESGFRKVFEHIASHARRSLLQFSKGPEFAIPEHRLMASGEANDWAKAVRQLILTADRKETIYFLVHQRGAWLSAYASHILGMAVKLLCRGQVLWEGAGSSGRATFELDQLPGPHLALPDGFFILESPLTEVGGNHMFTDYLLSEALGTELSLLADLSDFNSRAIQAAIFRYAGSLQESLTIDTANECDTGLLGRTGMPLHNGMGHKPNGAFGSQLARLSSVCIDLGFSDEALQDGLAWLRRKARSRFNKTEDRVVGFAILDYIGQEDMLGIREWASNNTILLRRVKNLIRGFGMTIFALLPCLYVDQFKYDPNQLRVRSSVINGQYDHPPWTPLGWVRPKEVLGFLSDLLHGPGTVTLNQSASYLAVSAESTTIYYRVLFDEDCFDAEGRTIGICPGRITLAGAQRKVVVGEHFILPGEYSNRGFTTNTTMPEIGINKVARDVEVQPYYVDIPVHAEMDARLEEHVIAVSTRIVSSLLDSYLKPIPVSLHTCIHNLLLCLVGKPCGHDRMAPLLATSDNIEIATFLTHTFRKDYDDPFALSTFNNSPVRLFALKDAPLKQLLQMGLLRSYFQGMESHFIMLQGESCLSCAIREAGAAREENMEEERKNKVNNEAWRAKEREGRGEVVGGGRDVIIVVMT